MNFDIKVSLSIHLNCNFPGCISCVYLNGKKDINVKKMHENRISYDLTLGREGLERNINPTGSFPGVIMEKLKQNKNLLHFQQVSWSFML